MANTILISGLLLLLVGSEITMRGGIGLARLFDVPPLITGVVVIGVITVLPEMFVAMRAATLGKPDVVIGGLIGSNIINILFVMGLGALVHPMVSPPKVVFRDGGFLLVGALGLLFCGWVGVVSRHAAVMMLLLFAGYIALTIFTDWRRAPEHSVPLARALYRSQGAMISATAATFLLLLGLILLALGAHLSVEGAVFFASERKLTETTIALTILAAGLSQPKLIATMIAATRGQTNIAVGQILDTGVFTLLAVIGVTALVHPLTFSPELADNDTVVLAVSVVALLPLLAMRWRMSRPRGILLMIAYGCYVAFLLWRHGISLPWFH